ncbi:hypothetical protein RI129_007908 [Pyrocoelia pectoralis]|uniref:TIL domain-containing protein n=1 Tax=Pyrocoelia pectoralis TaxID=417401 RepID=A0AAN7ZLY6_9COLE
MHSRYNERTVEFYKLKCPEDEEFVECGSHCQPTCDKPILDPNMNCRLDCANCACRKGYIREKAGGKCIKKNTCPIRCSINEIRNDCANRCLPERTCQNPNPKPDPDRMCIAACLPGCECDVGFIRDRNTRRCVRLDNCPSSVEN